MRRVINSCVFRKGEGIEKIVNSYSAHSGPVYSIHRNPTYPKVGPVYSIHRNPTYYKVGFNPIIEFLQSKNDCGFNLNEEKIITLPYADDFCLITTDLRKHQKIQNEIKSKIESMRMRLKLADQVSLAE